MLMKQCGKIDMVQFFQPLPPTCSIDRSSQLFAFASSKRNNRTNGKKAVGDKCLILYSQVKDLLLPEVD